MKAPTRPNLRGLYFVRALKNQIAGKFPLVLQSRLWGVSAGFVVAVLGAVLVFSAPEGAADHVSGVVVPVPGDAGDQVPDFGQGKSYQLLGAWIWAPFFERMTLRKAWANMERVMCRYQPVYCRT